MTTYANVFNLTPITGTVIIGNGTGSGFTTLAYSSVGGSSNIVSRDASGNSHSNNFKSALTNHSSGGTKTLTVASTRAQVFGDGVTTSTAVLPNATTLPNGCKFEFSNNANGVITVQRFGGTTLFTMVPGSSTEAFLLDNSTAVGTWDYHSKVPSVHKFGNSGLNIAGTLATSPPSSSEANSGFGPLVIGTPLQNNLGYNILVNIRVAVTLATNATIVLGVGPTSPPATNPVCASFSVGLISSFCTVVPDGHYCLIDKTGTITIGSVTTQVCAI